MQIKTVWGVYWWGYVTQSVSADKTSSNKKKSYREQSGQESWNVSSNVSLPFKLLLVSIEVSWKQERGAKACENSPGSINMCCEETAQMRSREEKNGSLTLMVHQRIWAFPLQGNSFTLMTLTSPSFLKPQHEETMDCEVGWTFEEYSVTSPSCL